MCSCPRVHWALILKIHSQSNFFVHNLPGKKESCLLGSLKLGMFQRPVKRTKQHLRVEVKLRISLEAGSRGCLPTPSARGTGCALHSSLDSRGPRGSQAQHGRPPDPQCAFVTTDRGGDKVTLTAALCLWALLATTSHWKAVHIGGLRGLIWFYYKIRSCFWRVAVSLDAARPSCSPGFF